MSRAKRSLIVVSNRLPFRQLREGRDLRLEPTSGGLATAMLPVIRDLGRAWIGWSGNSQRTSRVLNYSGNRIVPIHLTPGEVDDFYHGFANRTLWPLYHDAILTPTFDNRWWNPYVKVNHRFARKVASLAKKGDLIWVHDYHLQMVPAILRRLRPDLQIGFFLHIPFPPEELFAWLPKRGDLARGLLGADVVGFQTYTNSQNFSRAARRYTEAEGTDTELQFEGRTIRIDAFPISVDFESFSELADSPEVRARMHEIRRRIGTSRKVILSVDRLDYTKGIDLRLTAIEQLFRRKIVSVDECVFVQIAVPSRERVHEYNEIRNRVERIVGRINGEYSLPGRVAVHYFRRSVPVEELVAFYLAADIMMVTPLRDGMNLVAKEYCATRTDLSGVLILSEFAGASRELRQAILVNPHDVDAMVDAMAQALKFPRSESKHRMAVMRTIIRRHDVHEWANLFLQALRDR